MIDGILYNLSASLTLDTGEYILHYVMFRITITVKRVSESLLLNVYITMLSISCIIGFYKDTLEAVFATLINGSDVAL
jgi:hypothetical protein